MQFSIHILCGTGICSLLRRGFVNHKHIRGLLDYYTPRNELRRV